MKKINICLMALVGIVFMACKGDYLPSVGPQQNLPESQLKTTDVTVEPIAQTIDLTSLLTDPADNSSLSDTPIPLAVVSVVEGQMPANTILKAEVQLSRNADFADYVSADAESMESSNTIAILPQTLEDAYFNFITRNPAKTDLYMRVVLYTVTNGKDIAIVGQPGANYFNLNKVEFTPLSKVVISQKYYVIGGAKDWNADAARTQQFQHSSEDVYVDPIFTIIIDANASGDTWFAIGDDAALDAVAAGDWTKLLGTKGDSKDSNGQLDFRYNLGGDHSFCVPQGAKKIKIELNMLEYTYSITPVSISDAYYLIGGPGEWNAESAMTMRFSHSDKDVFDDPVFTYVFAGTGSEMWFAFGDEEAITLVGNGTWDHLFGTLGDSKDLSGKFDYRYNLGGDHSFCVDGTAKFYRFQVNMATMSYTITPMNFTEFFYEIGNESGWSTSHALRGAAFDGKYQGYYYLNGEFKFKPNADNWDDDLEYVSGTTLGGTLQSSGGPNCPDPGAGFYQIDLNAAESSYALTKVSSITMVGSHNGWNQADASMHMNYNTSEGCWEIDYTFADNSNVKFAMNDDWSVSWGGANGDATNYSDLTQNGGKDLSVAAGSYKVKLYLSYEGNNKVVFTAK